MTAHDHKDLETRERKTQMRRMRSIFDLAITRKKILVHAKCTHRT